MSTSSNVRAQVMAQIEDVIRAARAAGKSEMEAMDVASRTFPGTPSMVIIEAATNVDMQLIEGWWQQVERTIDAEVIKTSLVRVGEVKP